MAKLAEQAERYDEMVEEMKKVAQLVDEKELSVEERNLLSVAYKNVVGWLTHGSNPAYSGSCVSHPSVWHRARRASLRIIGSIEAKEMSKNDESKTALIRAYKTKVEGELKAICEDILGLLDTSLISSSLLPEPKVFYEKMKADYYRYIAEFSGGDAKSKAAENARVAYTEAQNVAEKDLAVTHPIRLGLALNFSVFQYLRGQDISSPPPELISRPG